MQISANSVERLNSPVYSAPPCIVLYCILKLNAFPVGRPTVSKHSRKLLYFI